MNKTLMTLFVVTVFLSYVLSVNLSYAVPYALKNIANIDGIISPSGCNSINGTMINKQVNLLKTRLCYYDNYQFLITYDTHRGCVGSLGYWKDPQNNETFTFRSPCDIPNFALDEGIGFFFSPLKQIKLGVPFNQVTCSDHTLQLMTNPYSYTAICVKPSTAQKLVERDWVGTTAPSITQQTEFQTIKITNTPFSINYTITGGKLLSVNTKPDSVIELSLNTTNNGEIKLKVPTHSHNKVVSFSETAFFITIDGKEISSFLHPIGAPHDILSIKFQKGTKEITIGGTMTSNGMPCTCTPFLD